MAYRYDKEPSGDYAIIIDGWEKGIASDPYSGINRIRSGNLSTPGEISTGYTINTNSVSGATLGNPIARSTRYFSYTSPASSAGTPQSFAILDDTGHVFESTSVTGTFTYLSNNATTTGTSSSNGISYWLGYLFRFRDTNIDYWNGTIWVNAWQTITGSTRHFAYVASDNVLYFTNGNYLGSITAPTPSAFDPTNAATYAFSTTKLQLPVGDSGLSIAEVGGGNSPQSTLLIGGTKNAIYPWDKVSSSFALPIYVADPYINRLVSVNQNAFIFPGNQNGRGKIYITNGAQANLYYKIPDYIFGQQDPYYVWGDAIFHRNNLLFGFFVIENDTVGNIASTSVWALDLETKAFRGIGRMSTVSGYANAQVLISGDPLAGAGFNFITGWNDGASIPNIGSSSIASGTGNADVITDLIPIGTFLQKKTFSQVEYKLRSPLESGETISITPIVDGVSGTTFTFSPTPATGVISGTAPMTFQGAQWLQFDVATVGNSLTSGVRLHEIRIR